MYRNPLLNDYCYFNNAEIEEIPKEIIDYKNSKTFYLNDNKIK